MANTIQDELEPKLVALFKEAGMQIVLETLVKVTHDARAEADAEYLQQLSYDLQNTLRNYKERYAPMSATG